jgi:hypothetical protein
MERSSVSCTTRGRIQTWELITIKKSLSSGPGFLVENKLIRKRCLLILIPKQPLARHKLVEFSALPQDHISLLEE